MSYNVCGIVLSRFDRGPERDLLSQVENMAMSKEKADATRNRKDRLTCCVVRLMRPHWALEVFRETKGLKVK